MNVTSRIRPIRKNGRSRPTSNPQRFTQFSPEPGPLAPLHGRIPVADGAPAPRFDALLQSEKMDDPDQFQKRIVSRNFPLNPDPWRLSTVASPSLTGPLLRVSMRSCNKKKWSIQTNFKTA